MSIFVDKVITRDDSAIQVEMAWHHHLHILAIGSYSEDKGGGIEIIDQFGYIIDEGKIPFHPTAQTSCLAWHPQKKILMIGWDNGDFYLYVNDHCIRVENNHTTSIHLAQWSNKGSVLITTDKNGIVIGWKSDGSTHLEMIFHHELKDTLNSLVFCPSQPGFGLDLEASMNLSGLARAAVAGDERALDLFSSWKPSEFGSNQDVTNAFAGSSNGVIYFLNENGSCSEVLQADGAVKKLLMGKKDLIIITENMIIGQFKYDNDGNLKESSRVKLSTRTKENHITWIDQTHLAISGGDLNIRIWNLVNDDNFVLSVQSDDTSSSVFITSLNYNPSNKILAAGTNSGMVGMFQSNTSKDFVDENAWRSLTPINIGNTIRKIEWASQANVLALNTIRQVFFLTEQQRAIGFFNGTTAVQISPSDIQITFAGFEKSPTKHITNISIEKIQLSENSMVVYGHGKILCYELQPELQHIMANGDFELFCDDISVREQSVYTLESVRINVRSFQGTIKQTVTLPENEGLGISINIYGKYLVVTTKNAIVKIWDTSKRDLRLHTHPINIRKKIPDFSLMGQVKLNSSGTFLSVVTDSRIYIYDFESNATHYFNYNSGRNERDDAAVPPNSAQSTASQSEENSIKNKISGRTIVHHSWDENETNFLVCHTRPAAGVILGDTPEGDLVVSMFYHEEIGLMVHDTRNPGNDQCRLIGVAIPFIFMYNEAETVKKESDETIVRILLKDFEGLESSDSTTKEAVINFCFYLSLGNMDEAFRSIKSITNKKVWGNLARMCVKSQRLDVAMICLGKMEHAMGARAMRRINNAKVSKDVQVAVLAIYLGMYEEAEEILNKCGHYELLNKYYQDSNEWQKALEVAEKHDRIHLRSTNYNYAKHLESRFDVGGAIAFYEKSGTSRFEVPRLLFEDWGALESYVNRSDDKNLKRWLAQYLESTGEMDSALHYYNLAEDYLSLVRVYCYCDKMDKAAEIANTSGNKAACYHLARQFENMDDIQSAIHFFSKAQAYSNAIRICKDNHFEDQVWNLALLANSNEKLEAAKYFEKSERPQYNKAVILYEKAGFFAKALELAINTNQHNALLTITKELQEVNDPFLSAKAANFFLENKLYEKAMELFVSSHQCEKALELCLEYNITITEDIADKLSVDQDNKVDVDLLNQVAAVCYRQGNYHLATKKWTQAGNRLQAMKSLLKSGDTEKIIFFANVSRDRDIYILAGNYLQTLDWRNNADIMKHIIQFYQKSKSYDKLGWFYQACADVEIDEYQNYEKALGALSECVKCLKKSEDNEHESQINKLYDRMELIKKFVEGQNAYMRDPDQAIKVCNELLKEENINQAVRRGDIYGFLIEHYVKIQNYRAAQQTLSELQKTIPNVNLAYYVNSDVLLSIEKALGVSLLPENAPQIDDDEIEDQSQP